MPQELKVIADYYDFMLYLTERIEQENGTGKRDRYV